MERSPIFFESMAEAAKEGKKALAHLLAEQAAWPACWSAALSRLSSIAHTLNKCSSVALSALCGLICNRFNRDTDLLEDAQMRPAADVRRGSDDEVAVYFMIVSPSFRKVIGVLFIGAVALFGWFSFIIRTRVSNGILNVQNMRSRCLLKLRRRIRSSPT
jgi:hypothetical protein